MKRFHRPNDCHNTMEVKRMKPKNTTAHTIHIRIATVLVIGGGAVGAVMMGREEESVMDDEKDEDDDDDVASLVCEMSFLQ